MKEVRFITTVLSSESCFHLRVFKQYYKLPVNCPRKCLQWWDSAGGWGNREEKPCWTRESYTQCPWDEGAPNFLTAMKLVGVPLDIVVRAVRDFWFLLPMRFYFLSAQDLGKPYTQNDPFLSVCAWCVSTGGKHGEPKLAGRVGEGVSLLLENRLYQLPTFWVLLWFRISTQGLVFTSYSSGQEWVFPCI